MYWFAFCFVLQFAAFSFYSQTLFASCSLQPTAACGSQFAVCGLQPKTLCSMRCAAKRCCLSLVVVVGRAGSSLFPREGRPFSFVPRVRCLFFYITVTWCLFFLCSALSLVVRFPFFILLSPWRRCYAGPTLRCTYRRYSNGVCVCICLRDLLTGGDGRCDRPPPVFFFSAS